MIISPGCSLYYPQCSQKGYFNVLARCRWVENLQWFYRRLGSPPGQMASLELELMRQQPLAPQHPRGCGGTLAEVSQPSCMGASPQGLQREGAALTSTTSAQAQSPPAQPRSRGNTLRALPDIHSRCSAQKKPQCEWWVLHVNFKR